MINRTGAWVLPDADEIDGDGYAPVRMEGIPAWLASLDSLAGFAGSVVVLVGSLAYLPWSPAPLASAGLAGMALLAGPFFLRRTMEGLSIGRRGIRVRGILRTRSLAWGEIDAFTIDRGPAAYGERWELVGVRCRQRGVVWVPSLRRPRSGNPRLADETDRASYDSLERLVADLNVQRQRRTEGR